MKIRKGDKVQIIAGKDRGTTGEVVLVHPTTDKIVVKGVNMATRHIKSKQAGAPGERVTKEVAIHVSNVMLVCPEKNVPTRIGYRMEGAEKVRFSKKSGSVL
jgi:large subunit ribosomal protein L24